ncbi:hypothetical protein PYW07_012609 [Mythimna separata]|uniref:Uncharacterized protein n=1 Tax=Mythimna separata TaxID=271217 RepID=A0AAD7Y8M6_MYTSE|nr:hypothetical protein PYW07_012609 [Mythimna separata]
MFDMKDFELSEMFQNVTGISVHDNTEMTHHRVCWECAARLTAASTFRDKALLSDALLKDIAHMKKSDITTLKQNYSMLKSRLTVFTALSHFNIKYEQTDKEIVTDEVKYEQTDKKIVPDEVVSNEIKTEIDQNEIDFEEHEPWLDIHVKMEVESNSVSENNNKDDAFKKLTHTNNDSTSKEDFSCNKSDIAARLTVPTALNSSDIENKDKKAICSNETVLKETIIKQERKGTGFEEKEPWEDISVKIEIESDTIADSNTKRDAFIEGKYSNNDSTFKEDSRCGIRSTELQNDIEEDAKMSYDTVISDDSNRKVNIVEVNDKEMKSKLNVISIIEEDISSEDDSQCLAELVSVEKAKRKDKL